MKAKYECQGCFTEFTLRYDFMAPFCSEYCEYKFLDSAPVKLIASVYEDFKTFIDMTYVNEGSSNSVVEKEVVIIQNPMEEIDINSINTISCNTCSIELDYGINDKRVSYYCSSKCVDTFLNNIDRVKEPDKSIYIN